MIVLVSESQTAACREQSLSGNLRWCSRDIAVYAGALAVLLVPLAGSEGGSYPIVVGVHSY